MYSFDIFDTLITRTTATPQGIFAIMRHKLKTDSKYGEISRYITDNFFELRIHSEELARLNNEYNSVEEITLEEIYDAIALTGSLSEEDKKLLCDLERESEYENTVGIEQNIIKLKGLLSQGETVILVSDMYLDLETVRKLLVKTDPIFSEIPIFISSECRKRKITGNLYRTIKNFYQIEYPSWTHYGDNLLQDIEIPYGLGIKVQHYPVEALTKFEDELMRYYGSNISPQIMIGAAKHARMSSKSNTIAERIGTTYCGPILFGYSKWLLNECLKKGITRLYFIARDGYLIKRIADQLIDNNEYAINTHYIYGSRKTWRLQSLSFEEFNLSQIIQWSNMRRIKTIGKLAEVLMLTAEELFAFLPKGCRNENILLTEQTLRYLVDRLEQTDDFKEFYVHKMEENRNTVRDYLRQEIDWKDDHFAFVDVAGGGLTQGCLKMLLDGMYDKPIQTFYFKMDRVNLVKECINYVYLPSFLKNNLVIEMICRAPHGQTIGYKRCSDKVVPLFDEEKAAVLQHDFTEYENGIMNYVTRMQTLTGASWEEVFSIQIIIKYLEFIASRPDHETLEYFASMPSNETGRGNKILEFAPRLSREDIVNIFLKRSNENLEDYYEGSNLDYSLMRCSRQELEYIEQCKKEYHSANGILIRQEKNRVDKQLIERFGIAGRFPCEILEDNIIIYGAGKFGQSLYKMITMLRLSRIVHWVDKEYDKHNSLGETLVEAPDVIGAKDYDQIVIAVMHEELAHNIRQQLISRGIPAEKILWVNTNQNVQNYVNDYILSAIIK